MRYIAGYTGGGRRIPTLILGVCLVVMMALAQATDLVVSAASSLTDALNTMRVGFEARYPGQGVRFNFAASGVLARQIEAGAPVDLFISASPQEMDRLERAGRLVPGTRHNLLTNRIVLIVPRGSDRTIDGFEGLRRAHRVAIGDPRFVPAGRYAHQVLNKLGLSGALAEHLVYGENVRQVLDYAARGEVDAGLVFATDAALLTDRVRLVAQAPATSHDPIVYPIAVLRDSTDPAAAIRFETYLSGPEARKVFTRDGFGNPEP